MLCKIAIIPSLFAPHFEIMFLNFIDLPKKRHRDNQKTIFLVQSAWELVSIDKKSNIFMIGPLSFEDVLYQNTHLSSRSLILFDFEFLPQFEHSLEIFHKENPGSLFVFRCSEKAQIADHFICENDIAFRALIGVETTTAVVLNGLNTSTAFLALSNGKPQIYFNPEDDNAINHLSETGISLQFRDPNRLKSILEQAIFDPLFRLNALLASKQLETTDPGLLIVRAANPQVNLCLHKAD